MFMFCFAGTMSCILINFKISFQVAFPIKPTDQTKVKLSDNKLADNKKYLENYRLYSNKPNPISKKKTKGTMAPPEFLWVGVLSKGPRAQKEQYKHRFPTPKR